MSWLMVVRNETYALFQNALLKGDRRSCWSQVSALLDSDVSLEDLYLSLFKPALYEVGASTDLLLQTVGAPLRGRDARVLRCAEE